MIISIRENMTILAQQAGALIQEGFYKCKPKFIVKEDGSYCTDYDKESERFIVDGIKSLYPTHNVFGEEGYALNTSKLAQHVHDCNWIVDPIDGTSCFISGQPFFSVSIAYQHQGLTQVGVVHMPILNSTLVAERGKLSTLNGQELQVVDDNRVTDPKGRQIKNVVYTGAVHKFIHDLLSEHDQTTGLKPSVIHQLSQFKLNITTHPSTTILLNSVVSYNTVAVMSYKKGCLYDIVAPQLALEGRYHMCVNHCGDPIDYYKNQLVIAGHKTVVKEMIAILQPLQDRITEVLDRRTLGC